jgi:hypothetical protein
MALPKRSAFCQKITLSVSYTSAGSRYTIGVYSKLQIRSGLRRLRTVATHVLALAASESAPPFPGACILHG